MSLDEREENLSFQEAIDLFLIYFIKLMQRSYKMAKHK